MEWFGVFDDNQDVIDEEGKAAKRLAEEEIALSNSIKENTKALKEELDLLNATTEIEKMAIKLKGN